MAIIQNTPIQERPRERCLETGASCLSLRECLSLILGSGPPGIGCMGLATQILEKPGTGLDVSAEEKAFFMAMETAGTAHVKEVNGLGPALQARILAAFELGRRYSVYRYEHSRAQRSTLPQSTLARQALRKISQKDRSEPKEWLGFVPIHRSGEMGELCVVERGVRTHVNTEPAELFARILALRPRGFFLFHNHPSGNMNPSPQDLDLTERVQEISRTFGLQLLGHGIVSSLNEEWIKI
jgi:DNA repair protein RadC